MTSAPAATSEMDHLDELGAKAFDGYLVRKDLLRNYSRQYPVPTSPTPWVSMASRSSWPPQNSIAAASVA